MFECHCGMTSSSCSEPQLVVSFETASSLLTCPWRPPLTCPWRPPLTCPWRPLLTCPWRPLLTCPWRPLLTCPWRPLLTCPWRPLLTCPCDLSLLAHGDLPLFAHGDLFDPHRACRRRSTDAAHIGSALVCGAAMQRLGASGPIAPPRSRGRRL